MYFKKVHQNSHQNKPAPVPGENNLGPQDFDPLLADQYRRVHLDLFHQWGGSPVHKHILKTDLYAEALCVPRAFLMDILKTDNHVIGMDISTRITRMAGKNLSQNGYNSRIENINCDVRYLPFKSNYFDLIVSDSTLDHFAHRREIAVALGELHRVLAPGGTLIVTMDNKSNITEPLFRLWIKLGLSPFFIGDTYNIKQLKTELARIGFQVAGETALIHNPRYFTKVFIKILRRIHRNRFDTFIGRILHRFDRLETKRTRYLTAQFIAVKALKSVSDGGAG